MNKNFYILLQGQFFSTVGSSLFIVLMIIYGNKSFGSATLVGSLLMFSQLPGAVLGPVFSGVIDSSPKKKILIVSDLISGILILFLFFIFKLSQNQLFNIISMFVCVTLLGVMNSFIRPAVFSLSHDIVDEKSSQKSTSYLQASLQLGSISANGLGGVLYSLLGPSYLILLNSLTYLLSAYSERFIRVKPSRKPKGSFQLKQVMADSKNGLDYILKTTELKHFFMMSLLINLSFSPLVVALPFKIMTELNLSETVFGYAMSSLGMGMFLGYLVSSRLKFSNLRLSLVFLLLMNSVLFFFLGECYEVSQLIALCFSLGFFMGLINAPLLHILQSYPPKSYTGRVMSFFINSMSLVTPIGMGLSGLAIDLLSGKTAFIFGFSAVMLLVSSFSLVLSGSQRKFLTPDS